VGFLFGKAGEFDLNSWFESCDSSADARFVGRPFRGEEFGLAKFRINLSEGNRIQSYCDSKAAQMLVL
jgi:hypothetical protein